MVEDRRVAVDGPVPIQPELCSGAGSATQITGQFTQQSAEDLAILIKGGALPVPVEVIEQRTVGATLGDQAIRASVEAAVIGIALTGLFIVIVYRLVGLIKSRWEGISGGRAIESAVAEFFGELHERALVGAS